MPTGSRRNHSATFKSKLALAAVKGDKTIPELSLQHDVPPGRIEQWKTQLLERISLVFEESAQSESPPVDITALREREAHLRAVTNTLPDPMWLKDPDGFYIHCNREFERLMGAKESEITGKTDYDLVTKERADIFL